MAMRNSSIRSLPSIWSCGHSLRKKSPPAGLRAAASCWCFAGVILSHRDLGGAGRPPLVLLHGMLGSSRNWQTTGRDLAEHCHVLAPDLRNHGMSPHAGSMRYDEMVADVLAWIEAQGLARATLLGHSMGGKVAMLLACRHPERVERLLAVCGSARTAPHNWVFLEGVKAALLADPSFAGGQYRTPPRAGLAAFGRVYAGWAYSQAFFREGLYQRLGHASPVSLLEAWERDHQTYDANDLLCVLDTWQRANIADNERYRGDFVRALRSIQARSIVMPCSTDLYFPVEDNRLEVAHLAHGELRVLESKFGHVAGGPNRIPEDTAVVEAALRELLAVK